jgi:hypothetical protein
MAEIRNYTMNFSSGRPSGLTCSRKSACTEMHGFQFAAIAMSINGMAC